MQLFQSNNEFTQSKLDVMTNNVDLSLKEISRKVDRQFQQMQMSLEETKTCMTDLLDKRIREMSTA